MALRILVSDGTRTARRGVHVFLEFDAEPAVGNEYANSAKPVRLVNNGMPDVVLMGLLMRVMDGIAATSEVRERFPGVEVIALNGVQEDALAFGNYLREASDVALRDTGHGPPRQVTVSQEAAMELLRQMPATGATNSLTERETDVLRLLAQGQANKEIAHNLTIGEKTVKTHVSNILAKLGVRSRTQAALHAMQSGLIPPIAG
jgi:two-component system, NarL family, response regulator LiaR